MVQSSAVKTRLILASSSPRRKELLSDAGVTFSAVVSNCDEAVLPKETPEAMVKRLARAKAEAVAALNPDALVIGADTTVFLNDEILGKPENVLDAQAMLAKIAGREHVVWGGVALVHQEKYLSHVEAYETKVLMSSMSSEQIAWYVETGEPMDKAGSYAIQGIGLQFVEKIDGSYSNVVGLNISKLMEFLRSYGYIF